MFLIGTVAALLATVSAFDPMLILGTVAMTVAAVGPVGATVFKNPNVLLGTVMGTVMLATVMGAEATVILDN